jgi:hypothetical protein
MKKINQISAWFAITFIGVIVMTWILDKMVSFLGLMFLHPLKAFGYVILGSILVYGLSKIKDI